MPRLAAGTITQEQYDMDGELTEEGSVSNRNGLTAKLRRPKSIISVDCSLEIRLWKETGMLKFALRPESIELSHSFVLACRLQVVRVFVSNFGVTEVAPNRKGSARQVHSEF